MGIDSSFGFRAGVVAAIAFCALAVLGGVHPGKAPASAQSVATNDNDAATSAGPEGRQVILLGLRRRGKPQEFASKVSSPASPQYRKFLTQAQYRKQFSATAANQRAVKRFLAGRKGVLSFRLNASHTVALAVVTPHAASRYFCVNNSKPMPARGLCRPKPLHGAVRQVSAGAVYQPAKKKSATPVPLSKNTGTPKGCPAGIKNGTFAPNQLSTAFGVDGLEARGLDGRGVRVVTLSSQMVDPASFKIWAKCFNLPTPKVKQFAMPGFGGTAPEETVLDVEALATLAPDLDRITPIFVPLDQGFSNSFLLFMFGALDPSRQGDKLPDILSLSDGVCEDRFTKAELQLGQRQLAEAAAMGITTLAAVGDLGFRACFTSARGTDYPASSRFTTGVGGTELFLNTNNSIRDQVVWSTFGSGSSEAVGTGGGASPTWTRPGFQTGPGIGPQIQSGKPGRLTPDISSMASFTPGLATFQKDSDGWGLGGGNSAGTPLAAAIVALTLQQEEKAGRPALGSLNPLLYQLARGPEYGSIFYDIIKGTSSLKPNSAAGRLPSGGAAQPGYDLATGLGTLKAVAFADAVAVLGENP
ncbi:MAG: S53 family peptidase [Solirubrobacterales bacterium]